MSEWDWAVDRLVLGRPTECGESATGRPGTIGGVRRPLRCRCIGHCWINHDAPACKRGAGDQDLRCDGARLVRGTIFLADADDLEQFRILGLVHLHRRHRSRVLATEPHLVPGQHGAQSRLGIDAHLGRATSAVLELRTSFQLHANDCVEPRSG